MIGRISKLILVGFVVLGCAQFASAQTTITVGASGADYTTFNDACDAVTTTDTTIRFIDSGTYVQSTQRNMSIAK